MGAIKDLAIDILNIEKENGQVTLYFSRITSDHWCSKNNLEKAAHKLAKEMDRRLVIKEQVPAFKKEFKDKIEKLNLEYHRCKPLRFYTESGQSYQEGDMWIYCEGVFHMSLFKIRG
jgi:hypothetical protein